MSRSELIDIVIGLVLLCGYVQNTYKFTQCDFEAPYRCEAVYGVGLIPIFGPFFGWFDFGK